MVVIHIIEDDPQVRGLLSQVLKSGDRQIYTYQDGEEFLDRFPSLLIDIAILDYNLPGKNGLQLMRIIKDQFPDVEAIMMTGVGDDQVATRAMELGAYDYLNKPLNPQEIRFVVDRAIKSKLDGDTLSYLFDQQRKLLGFGGLIGNSSGMKKVFESIKMVSESTITPVVIRGETGTGKGMVARVIHTNSQKGEVPFVEVNCAAIQPTLLESELFGYEQGAFTDARQPKRGLMEVANGGTFFLDEIGDMDHALQAKLLNAIEERKIRRVGGIEDIPINLRVISATSRHLEDLVEQGKFREDLYYRLNVVTIDLPPLRERGDDIRLLVDHFLSQFNNEFNFDVAGFTGEAMSIIMNHRWPGNVRELRNVIERAVLLKKTGTIDKHHLALTPGQVNGGTPGSPSSNSKQLIPPQGIDFELLEQQYLSEALRVAKGNKAKAAELLGMTRSTFRYRLKKYGDLVAT
ncbi:MAG TPA: sigma-54 dependent transcriptional regulator [bacterium]|nr:sigma-54 dependent transcriptional regulator [bacterium]